MKSKQLFLTFICSCLFLYYSNGQDLKLLADNKQPLEGAIVVFTSINAGNSVIYFSDNTGIVRIPELRLPMLRVINRMGYVQRVDTLNEAPQKLTIVELKSAPKNLGEVTVTGNYTSGYQGNSVYSIDVINRKDIDNRAASTVTDVLSQQLNMRVSNDVSLGSSLSMQGIGGENIKYLVDGVPVIGRMNGNIDLGQLNLSNVERIEIVKGPMSAMYGTDAAGGVINIITKTNTKEKLSATVNSYYESNGQYNNDAQLGWGFKKSSITVSGGRDFFAGWSDPDTSRYKLWKPKEQYFGDLKFTHTINNIRFILQSSFFNEMVVDKSNVFISPYQAYARDSYYYTQRFTNELNVEDKINKNSLLQFTGAYSTYHTIKNTYQKNMVDLTQELTSESTDQDTTKFKDVFSRLTYTYAKPETKWNLLLGSELNAESAYGKRIDNAVHHLTDYAFYTSVEYKPINNFTIRPSARFIYNTSYPAPVIPSLNVLYKIGDNWSVRASYSKGFRAPSLKELYLDFEDSNHDVHGNPNLKAENSDHVLAAIEYRKNFNNLILKIEPSAFYNEIQHQISLVQLYVTSPLYEYINIDRFKSQGADIKFSVTQNNLHIESGVSYTGTWTTYDGTVSQTQTAWYPEVTSAADYTVKKFNTTFSVFWKYQGKRPVYILQPDNSLAKYINDDMQLMDFSIRQRLLHNKIAITIGLRNIFNITNLKTADAGAVHGSGVNYSSPVAMGRTEFVKLSITL